MPHSVQVACHDHKPLIYIDYTKNGQIGTHQNKAYIAMAVRANPPGRWTAPNEGSQGREPGQKATFSAEIEASQENGPFPEELRRNVAVRGGLL